MSKYLVKRLIRGIISVVIVVGIVILLVFSLINREYIFRGDPLVTKKMANEKVIYKYQCWEDYGYLDYFTYGDYLDLLVQNGELTSEVRNSVSTYGETANDDPDASKPYIQKFYDYCAQNGYTVVRLDAVKVGKRVKEGGDQQLFSYKNIPTMTRLWKFFTGILEVDTIHYVENDEDLVGERGLTFTFYDPAKGGKFSPAILGNGTKHKYLLYFDNKFPFIHQNVVKLHLGKSFSISMGIDVFDSLTQSQGSLVKSETTYPTGYVEESSDDLHTAIFSSGVDMNNSFIKTRFTDKYTTVTSVKASYSRIAISFIMGIFSAILAYLLGVPIGIAMARNKGKWFDKIATAYIVFILSVPSLAYIFHFPCNRYASRVARYV